MSPVIAGALRAFLDRLLRISPLHGEEQQAILALGASAQVETARGDLVKPGERVSHAVLVADGLLARYDLMRDGARQITAFHIPGDMCDLHSVVAPVTGWGIAALGTATVVQVPHDALREIAVRHSAIAFAFWRDSTLDASILAKGIANIGRKASDGRVAHLLCELGIRMERAGQGTRRDYPLAATQEQIGDAVGLTGVHVNRVLRRLRDAGLVTFTRQRVVVADCDRLAAVAEFTPVYLLPDEAVAVEAERSRRLHGAS